VAVEVADCLFALMSRHIKCCAGPDVKTCFGTLFQSLKAHYHRPVFKAPAFAAAYTGTNFYCADRSNRVHWIMGTNERVKITISIMIRCQLSTINK
jgi:hypothetical protein